jgi:hypothetical protein
VRELRFRGEWGLNSAKIFVNPRRCREDLLKRLDDDPFWDELAELSAQPAGELASAWT